jgi:hypothetical protein
MIGEMSLVDQTPHGQHTRDRGRQPSEIKQDSLRAVAVQAAGRAGRPPCSDGPVAQHGTDAATERKMAALRTLSAGLAHELNNPAAAVNEAQINCAS